MELGGVVPFDLVGQPGELADIAGEVGATLVQGADYSFSCTDGVGVTEGFFRWLNEGSDVGEVNGVDYVGGVKCSVLVQEPFGLGVGVLL